ncbi:hypothetical protein M406DRAFT_327950 [Cryphonectria parasitica EP155]|uniref:Uncharacterized protein n=1 Tax=Cryphonectria parasitica (strain ATCC 38755 / EP155) TaxID=660469 RepID=A0A9P5CPU0_CRYP1|nr:uncharacterized protein M406DRAFT_327950 [Cryphonectria parasitica EP155]KAF3766834.1 hypothetical protein M406DRAFT_327950 [Cryphonectria parasitica EP155]
MATEKEVPHVEQKHYMDYSELDSVRGKLLEFCDGASALQDLEWKEHMLSGVAEVTHAYLIWTFHLIQLAKRHLCMATQYMQEDASARPSGARGEYKKIPSPDSLLPQRLPRFIRTAFLLEELRLPYTCHGIQRAARSRLCLCVIFA